MSSVNKVMLIGNLGRDPEIRRLNNGDTVVNLNVATSESWRDKASGERKERTEWHRVVVFNEHAAKFAEQYLKKGSTVYVEGQIQTRKYTDKDGAERYTTEVVLQRFRGELSLISGGQREGEDERSIDRFKSEAQRQFGKVEVVDRNAGARLDDEIPF
jgi:single-strand DNA-binding protein